MCGIAGWLGCLPDAETYAARLQQAMRHRGPDASGVKSWPEATLVHTRLSIIDLTATGAQPMPNEDGTVWTVLNGEIYNHREIHSQLEKRGHRFRGHSDTEILPHLYEEEGSEFVSKLRGMFALAIYDTKARTLLLARDRFGIKPLFYSANADRLAFASEIRALLELPGVDTLPDKQAIYDFAALFYIPAPETFYTGIRALEPGELLEVHSDSDRISCKTRKYHHWSIAPDSTLTLDEATDRADALLTSAVRRQMESDVPLGTLLSGGIDSSLVSAAAQDGLPGKLQTFNVRFSEKEYDETGAAHAVARHIGSQHTTLEMPYGSGSWESITKLLMHAGQPFADTSLFAVNAVCRLMRQHVTVALSGDGGDEGFAGYDMYWRIADIDRLTRIPAVFCRMAAAGLTPLARLGLVRDSLPQRVKELIGADHTRIVQNLVCWIREEEHRNLCQITDALPIRRLFEPQWEDHLGPGVSPLAHLSAHLTEVNTRLVLPNDFLFKVDLGSMTESLEVRVPMLDEDLFSFGISLPHQLNVNGRTCKQVLREVAQRRLPQDVAAKKKAGFGIPVDTWVDADCKAQLREALLSPGCALSDYFRPEAYRPVVDAFCGGSLFPGVSRQGLYQRVIMLLSAHLALVTRRQYKTPVMVRNEPCKYSLPDGCI